MEDWKYRAKDKLRDYSAQLNAVATLPLELKRLESEYTSIKAANTDVTPVQGGGTTQEDRALSNIVRRQEIEAMLYRAKKSVAFVEAALARLSEEERLVLELMYINRQRGAVGRLREELHLEDERSVYKRADKALKRLTIACTALRSRKGNLGALFFEKARIIFKLEI